MKKKCKFTGRVLSALISVAMLSSLFPTNLAVAATVTETVYAAAYQNATELSDTTLPESISVNGKETAVTWEWRSSKFSVAYETVDVAGTTDQGDTVNAKVEVIPEKETPLVYFVDVSRDSGKESKAFDSVSALTGNTLKNKVADQIYSETDQWGRKAAYSEKNTSNVDVTDKSQTGLYGENSNVNSITWEYYLEEGTYTLTAGTREWWTGPRNMKIRISGSNVDTVVSDTITVSKSDPVKTTSLNFTVKTAGVVTMDVENIQGSDAPVLTWFGVAKGITTVSDVTPENEIVIRGSDVESAAQNVNGLTWKGYGLLSGNSTSDLLMDYKEQSPEAYWEMLQTLFGGEYPLLDHVKIEMGNDGNNSTGADSCTMRFEDEEADASRSPGFQLAADAKTINPQVKVSILRWEMPAWVQSKWSSDKTGAGYEAVYKWYKETIFDAYEKYGYILDYVDPDKNETTDPDESFIKWFKKRVVNETDFPDYMDQAAIDAYHNMKIIASDENTSLNIVPSMRSDSELYDAVDAIGFHYSTGTQTTTADYRTMADVDDKEVWYSEGCATFSYTEYQENKTASYGGGTIGGYQSPLALADNFISSFVYSRKTHYIFQPAVGSFYEGAQYDHKEIISAREPWSGSMHYDPMIYMIQHFTKFAKTGWENEDNTAGIWRVISSATGNTSGNRGDLGHLVNESGNPSYMTLAAPDKSAFSVVIVNNSSKSIPYAVKAENMNIEKGAPVEIWETKTDSYMQYQGEAAYENGYYVIEVEPFSMVTLTTLDCDSKAEYTSRLPEGGESAVLDTDATGAKQDATDNILYADDFEYSTYDENYLSERGNEPRYAVDFTGAYVVEDGKLKQLLNTSVGQWNSNEPNTVIGDYRWMNYKAGVDVQVAEGSYAGINIRQQTGMGFEGSGYNLRITKDGTWTLKKRSTVIGTGSVEASKDGSYRLELEGRDNCITAWVDGQVVSVYYDSVPEYFGRVRLGCGWAETTYDNLKVETIEGYEPYATCLIDNASDDVTYTGSWDIVAGSGGSSNDWYRSTSTTTKAGSAFSFEINGGGFALIGNNGGTAILDVDVDGVSVAGDVETQASEKHEATYLQYGLGEGNHQVTVTVKSGTFVLDAIEALPVNTQDREGRIESVETVYGAAYEGGVPVLQKTVEYQKADGTKVTEEVDWDLDSFRGKAYETAFVYGVTKDSKIPVGAKVEVVPQKYKKLLYFIDASRDEGKESKAFDLISDLCKDSLINTVADQAYDAATGWGRTTDVFREKTPGSTDDLTNKYQTGWYSNTKTDWLTYEFYLEAGDYELTAGFHEWWNGRSMKISVRGDNVDQVTSDAIAVSGVGDNAKGSVQFTVKAAGAVVLEIENATGGEAPVLSWFGVSTNDPAADAKYELEQVMAGFGSIDASKYTADSYQAYTKAWKEAQDLLADENADKEAVQKAQAALQKAYENLKVLTPAKSKLAAPSIKSVKSSVSKNGSVVTVTVKKVANAGSYSIYRKVGKKITVLGSTKTGTFKDTKPISGKKAYYYAVAIPKNTKKYTASKESAKKDIVLAKDTAKVTAKKAGKTVKVSYKKVSGAKGYVIYRSTSKNGTYTKLTKKPVKGLTYTDQTVKSGKTYFYKVVVYGNNKTYSAGKVSAKVSVK